MVGALGLPRAPIGSGGETNVALELGLRYPGPGSSAGRTLIVGPGHDGRRTNRATWSTAHSPMTARKRSGRSSAPSRPPALPSRGRQSLLTGPRARAAPPCHRRGGGRALIDRFGPVGLPVAAHVGRDRVEACLREHRQLVAPGIQDSGKPWHRTTGGPAPCSAMCIRMPSSPRCGAGSSLMAGSSATRIASLTTVASLRMRLDFTPSLGGSSGIRSPLRQSQGPCAGGRPS